jgi:mannobiose 2-epimerase
VRQTAVTMAQAVYEQGIDADGGLMYEAGLDGILDADKHWWPQAEAVAGFLNAYQISGRPHFLVAAERSWEFIEKCMVDRRHGEWFWLVSRGGVPGAGFDKVGPWKCPYHNSRACFEVMERLDAIERASLETIHPASPRQEK